MLKVQHLGALELADPDARNMRERHLAQILSYLHRHGPSSRAQIAAECGLGISTMSELIGELRGRQLVSESDPVRTQSAGRPLREVRLDAGHWLVGGLHIEQGTIRAKLATLDGRELTDLVHRIDDSVDLYESLASVLRRLLADRPPTSELVAVEVGMPGAVRRADGWLVWSKALSLRDVAFGEKMLSILDELLDEPIAVGVDNDCNYAALVAHACPSVTPAGPVGARERITVYIGGTRGIGGSIVARDELLRGSDGAAGEFGHIRVDLRTDAASEDAPSANEQSIECWCGRSNCLVTRAELTTLLVRGGLLERADAEELSAREPEEATRRLLAAADAGDGQVLTALTEAGRGLGALIDMLHGMINPDRVLIGGYLGTLGRHLETAIHSRFEMGAATIPKEAMQISVLDGNDEAVVLGAVSSAQQLCLRYPLHFTHGQPLS